MLKFTSAPPQQLIRPEGFDCPCGKHHSANIRYLKIGPGVIRLVSEALETLGTCHPMVVCGPHGYEVAGKKVCKLLDESNLYYSLCVLSPTDGGKLKPSEEAAGSLLLQFDHDCDLVLGVGSGVINDLCKMLSKTAKVPCMIVATAPSMDGYASDCSSVEIGGIKCSLSLQMPAAILCDTDILAQAPMHMIHAGFGDILAKYTSLCDWKLSSIITGEYHCDDIATLVMDSLLKTVHSAPGITAREEGAIQAITEALVLSGIGIAFAGTSHPASGLEHYFSHCWEMMMLERGQEYDLHGIQVGIGMLLTLKIIECLKSIRPTLAHAKAEMDRFHEDAWEQYLRRVFPKAADGIMEIERKAHKNDRAGRLVRATRAIEHWDEILELFETTLPSYEEVENLMLEVGMPTRPDEIGLAKEDVVDAFVCSRDIRDKYLLSSLVWDLGYTNEVVNKLREML